MQRRTGPYQVARCGAVSAPAVHRFDAAPRAGTQPSLPSPPRSPACRADWRRPCGACRRARRRSAGLPTSPARPRRLWPRCLQLGVRRIRHAALDHAARPAARCAARTRREVLGVPRRRVDRLLQVHARQWTWRRKNCVIHWSCWSPPGEPQREVRLAVAQRHASATASSAAACRARARPGGPPPARTSGRACRGRSRAPGSPARTAASRRTASTVTMLPAVSMMSKCTVSPGTRAHLRASAPSRRPHR